MSTILVTGGCGFIGSNFIALLYAETDWRVINLDKLTYAGNLENLSTIKGDRHRFVPGDICDKELVEKILKDEKPWAVVNFAAETHVDRSIMDSSPFLHTNIGGVQTILEANRRYPVERFLQVSTDEVYGDTSGRNRSAEDAALEASSPYAATKAASDLFCLAYFRTYDMPIMLTRSSNNYGPHQFPEKFIPLLIRNAIEGFDLPIYGDGKQARDWVYVQDNCRAIRAVLEKGKVGAVYNIGAGEERTNVEVVHAVCNLMAERHGADLSKLLRQIRFVADRPGHDRRYRLDCSKIQSELGWFPQVSFREGLERTIAWYLGHKHWIDRITSGEYRQYYESVYEQNWGRAVSHEVRGSKS
jgi:dTDP-glucose 4,6-dehydratase